MAFNHNGEYLLVGSDTETVHVFKCSVAKGPAGKSLGLAASSTGRPWMGSGMGSSTENAVGEEDMDRVIEQKRRNGSMGYFYSHPLPHPSLFVTLFLGICVDLGGK